MVGLSIVLEMTNNTRSNSVVSPRLHQVVNKSTVKVTNTTEMIGLHRRPNSGFLEHCFLCRRKLLPAKDIYMYQGDRGFCSVECRSKQMIMDEEESFRRENFPSFKAVKMNNSDSSTPSPSSSGGQLLHRRDPGNRAGGFAY